TPCRMTADRRVGGSDRTMLHANPRTDRAAQVWPKRYADDSPHTIRAYQRVRKRFPALESIRILEDESSVLWAHRCAGTYHRRAEPGEAYCRTPGGDCSLGRRPLRLDESQM